MTRAVKAVTTYRGRDPRDFTLCAFGGNGPLTGVEVARALGIRQVLVPPAPGVFSALGLLFSDTEHEVVRTLMLRGDAITGHRLQAAFAELEGEATAHLDGTAETAVAVTRYADVRFAGQAYELPVLVPAGEIDVSRLVADFVAEHVRTYGHGSAGRPGRRRRGPGHRTPRADDGPALRPTAPRSAPCRARRARGRPTSARLSASSRLPSATEPACSTATGRARCSSTRPTRPASSHRAASRASTTTATSRSIPMPDVDPITLEVVKNALASTADEMALVIMRSAYSPVVRDTLDYSTALCDRNGRIVAQGLTLAVQLGTFPTVMRYVLEELGTRGAAGRRLRDQRPVRLRRPAPARHLRDQAGLRRRCARGLRGDDGAPLRRGRHRARQRRSARDRDLPGGDPDPALEARRRRRRGRDAAARPRGQHPPADPRSR